MKLDCGAVVTSRHPSSVIMPAKLAKQNLWFCKICKNSGGVMHPATTENKTPVGGTAVDKGCVVFLGDRNGNESGLHYTSNYH